MCSSIYFCGVFLGGLVFGVVSDRVGRYPVLVFTMYAQLVVGIMVFFVENFALFNILRFCIGVVMQVNVTYEAAAPS